MMNEYGLIKIFSELYVGFNLRNRRELIDDTKAATLENYRDIPYTLAFLTPYETTAAGIKRQDTVNRWAGVNEDTRDWNPTTKQWESTHNEKPPERQTRVIKNEPLSGFKLAEEVRRTYWGGGNVVWRIEDPRGFEFEISSANLARIITECGISAGGVIEGKCIYGRLGKDNILIPEGSELWNKSYRDAEELERKSKRVAKNLVQPGSLCEMKNGEQSTYLGQFYVTELLGPSFDRQYNRWHDVLKNEIVESHLCGSRVDQYHAFKMTVSSSFYEKDSVVLYKDKRVVRVISQNDEYADVEKNRAYLNSSAVEINYASSSKSTYNIIATVFTNAKPSKSEFVSQSVNVENLQAFIKYNNNVSVCLQPGSKSYGNEIIVTDTYDGGFLSSLNVVYPVKTIKNANGYDQTVLDENAVPYVTYGTFYKVHDNKLTISITALCRDGISSASRYSYLNTTRYSDLKSCHLPDNRLMKQHVDNMLATRQFIQLFFKVDDTCVAISE